MKRESISGYANEYEFVRYLHNKKIKQLNPIFRELLMDLYGNVNEEETIIAWKNYLPQKADIFIKINGQTRSISLKKGIKNSVHASKISDFIHFLIINNIQKEIIMEYLKFQYADGTTNNKGNTRMSTAEYKILNQDKVDMINQKFNEKDFLVNAINFFVLKGNMSQTTIDVLVYGTINDFIWINKNDILKILLSKKEKYATGLHFSNLLCQPMSRNLNYNPKYENCRYCVQIKWYSLFDDIIENMNNKVLENSNKL